MQNLSLFIVSLLKVCDGQRHFGRWGNNKREPLPCFHGTNGPHIAQGLTEVELAFDRTLQSLAGVKCLALDVKVCSREVIEFTFFKPV